MHIIKKNKRNIIHQEALQKNAKNKNTTFAGKPTRSFLQITQIDTTKYIG